MVMRGDVIMKKNTSIENLADPFMETLFTRVFDGHRNNLGVICLPNMF